MLHQMCQQQTRRIKELEAEVARLLEPQPCGHPQADVVHNEEGTHFCDRCREVDEAVREEREACAEVADAEAIFWAPHYRHESKVRTAIDIASTIRQRAATHD